MQRRNENPWVLLLLLVAGVVLGGFIGTALSEIKYLGWLGYGNQFGLTSPLVLDLGVIVVQFALTIRFTISGIIGMFLAFFIYKKI